MTRVMSITIACCLTATAAGLEPGPVTVEADGKEDGTRPVKVGVEKETTAAPGTGGDQPIFTDLDVEPRTLYVTESCTATLTIGIRKVEIGGGVYPMDLFREVLDLPASQLSVFADGQVGSSETWITDSSGHRCEYEVFRVIKTIRAEEVGQIRVGPIVVNADYPTALRRSRFGHLKIAAARKETARTPAVFVEVKAPPVEDRPADFAGAIGCYRMQTTASPLRVRQGEPVTLTIAISGDPIESIAGPDLAQQAELAGRFDCAKGELIGDIEGGRKVFHRAIFPKQAGEQTVPSLSWSYFDARAERYVTLTSDPITLIVDPPTGGSATIALTEEATIQDGTTLTVLTGGISPNYVDADSVLADRAFTLTIPWIASLIAPPLAWLLLTVIMQRRARWQADTGLARRRHAHRRARALLRRALRDGGPDQRANGLALALKSYLVDRFDLPPGELTPAEARALLTEHGADDATARQVAEFFDVCQAARYALRAPATMSSEQAADSITRWIKQIERTTR